jgi:hypothetical protein
MDDRLFSNPNRLVLDYGQSVPGAVAGAEMTEMAKNIRSSRNVIDVRDYLSRHGWELFTVTTVQTGEQRFSLDATTSYISS